MNLHPSYNKPMGATSQTVASAIDTSIQENRTVHLDYTAAVAAELARECEGEADTGETHEFWGVTCDGESWRVHLDR